MTDKKRVLILTADAGFGHRSAANALAAALEDKYGEACEIEIVNPLLEKETPAFLRNSQEDYDRIVRDWPELYKLGYQANDVAVTSALLESSLTVLLYETMRAVVKRHRPDAIVTTYPYYQAPLGAYFTVKNRYIPLLTVITDLVTIHRLWYHPAADLCLVPTQAAADLAVENGLNPQSVKITGIPVHPMFAQEQRSPAEIRAELGWQPDLVTVLAMGSKRVERMVEFLHPLNHSGFPIQLAVIAGGDDELYNRLQATGWHVPTHIYNFVDNIPAMMRAADCTICKAGGLTVTEALASGLPMLLIEVIPGQETGNATYAVKHQAGALVEEPLLLLETMCHWLLDDRRLLRERAANAGQASRPQAAYDIADLVWETLQQRPFVRRQPFQLELPRLTELFKSFGISWE